MRYRRARTRRPRFSRAFVYDQYKRGRRQHGQERWPTGDGANIKHISEAGDTTGRLLHYSWGLEHRQLAPRPPVTADSQITGTRRRISIGGKATCIYVGQTIARPTIRPLCVYQLQYTAVLRNESYWLAKKEWYACCSSAVKSVRTFRRAIPACWQDAHLLRADDCLLFTFDSNLRHYFDIVILYNLVLG